ncbi:MAG: RnfABCDGE type electron transport complex subunit D [Alphaproteobacteria bacterium]|nr:RnfABCDGE type electron transport complex subunit D [Alphaproteobacteria bacterium]
MPAFLASPFLRDARHYQIAALSTLLVFNFGWIDFGARLENSALALLAALVTQFVCAYFTKTPLDLRSPLITGLSLSLLLRADEPWIHAAAGVIAIASKFLLRLDGKHIFNPAGFAIVVLLFAAASHVWISPGAWGSTVWLVALLCFFAILVLGAARRADIAVFFFGTHAALLLARAIWLGDPFAIPLHQLQSGSLLIFTFFMISDPRTSPDSRLGRFIFAASVAALAHYMAFFMQMRPALYVALIALSPFILLIDRILPAQRFAWSVSRSRPTAQGAVP